MGAAALLVWVNDHPPACSQGLRRILRAAAGTTGGIFGVHLLLLWELPLGDLGMGGQALAVYILSGLLVWLAQRVWSWLPRATPPSFLGDF